VKERQTQWRNAYIATKRIKYSTEKSTFINPYR